MSIQTQITRITTDKNTIRNKLVNLGLATSTDNLDTLATAIDGIVNQGAVQASVQEGDTYTIPAGYHNGSGTVQGVGGGGSYTLQAKTATPTKATQQITPDSGYYGLSSVSINPIPSNYADISGATATTPDVLAGQLFVNHQGILKAGVMVNNKAVSASFDGLTDTTNSYTIPEGYHNGRGKVSLTNDIENALANI